MLKPGKHKREEKRTIKDTKNKEHNRNKQTNEKIRIRAPSVLLLDLVLGLARRTGKKNKAEPEREFGEVLVY